MALFGRKSRPPRRKVNQEAWIAIDGTFATRRCTVMDISKAGAKLKIDDPTFIKPVFHLKFSPADRGIRCKIAWRKGLVMGVEFS
jgi:hypothetical protein